MKFLIFIIAALVQVSSIAVAGDCSLPYFNKCLQTYLPNCPQSMFPDLRTPGLTEQSLRPADKMAIVCRTNVVGNCLAATMAADNNLCLGPDLVPDDPNTEPGGSIEANPAPSPTPKPSPTSFYKPRFDAVVPASLMYLYSEDCVKQHDDDGTNQNDGDDNDDDNDSVDWDVAHK